MPLGWLEKSSEVQFTRTLDGISKFPTITSWSSVVSQSLQSFTTLPFALLHFACRHLCAVAFNAAVDVLSSLAIAKGAATMKAITVNSKKNFFIRRLPKPKEI